MDVNAPEWEAYETRFREIAEKAQHVPVASPPLDEVPYYLCLYGENGLPPEEEFVFLEKLAEAPRLHRLEVDTNYWQDTILFIPERRPADSP